jgi:OOP family OmpA-OmpF porin
MNLRAALLVALVSLSLPAFAQDEALRTQLFGEADRVMAAANAELAHVLAPVSYSEAARYYRDAQEKFERGRRVDSIRSDLAKAVAAFSDAIEAAGLARVTMQTALAAREDAEAADAATYAGDQWREAEEQFATAARRLQQGSLNRARDDAEEAEQEFREAELVAIENNYLSGARARIKDAKASRAVRRYAPKTLARAESLLAEAEGSLHRDRYDTDYPRTLAREANYEAQHAMYLADRIAAAEGRDLSYEDLLLEAEAPIVRVAGELDLVAELDEGFDGPTGEIVAAIEGLRADRESLRERDERLAFLEDELASLEARLGDESEQRRLQQQIQQRFGQLAAVFTRDEAQVLRHGNDVIVRMGLNFDSGSAEIKPEYFELLRKIQTAIDLFPGSLVEVQGHTDSFGADEQNMSLSLQRANAVQRYLLANMDVGSSTIVAEGYGETVPLANNETAEGRRRNRRIDLLIQPDLNAIGALLSAN